MMIDFKTMFLQQWKLFKNAKTEVDFSVVSKEKWKEAGQWPATVQIGRASCRERV